MDLRESNADSIDSDASTDSLSEPWLIKCTSVSTEFERWFQIAKDPCDRHLRSTVPATEPRMEPFLLQTGGRSFERTISACELVTDEFIEII